MSPMLGIRLASTDHWGCLGHRAQRREGRDRHRLLHRYNADRRSTSTTSATAPTRSTSRPTPRAARCPDHAGHPLHDHRLHRDHRAPHRAAHAASGLVVDQHGEAADRPQPRRAGDRCLRRVQRGGQSGRLAARARPRSCSPTRRRGQSTSGSTRGPGRTWSRLTPRASPGATNPQAFGPWATPVGHPRVRAVRPQVVQAGRIARAELPVQRDDHGDERDGHGEHRHRARHEGQVQVATAPPRSASTRSPSASRSASAATGSASSTRATRRSPGLRDPRSSRSRGGCSSAAPPSAPRRSVSAGQAGHVRAGGARAPPAAAPPR